MRSRSLTAFLVVALLSGAVGWCGSRRSHLEPLPEPRAEALLRARHELDAAAGMGFDAPTYQQEVEAAVGRSQIAVPLHANECVAAVAAVYQQGYIAGMQLQLENGGGRAPTRLVEVTGARLVAQVQWCSPVDAMASLQLDVRRRGLDSIEHQPRIYLAVARGPWARVGGPRAIARGQVTDDGLRALVEQYPDDAFAPRGAALDAGAPRIAPVAIEEGTAALLPGDERTYTALYRSSARDAGVAVNPRAVAVDVPSHPDAPAHEARRRAHAAPFDLEALARQLQDHPDGSVSQNDPVVDLGRNDFHRVLAVVDPAAVGTPCVTVVFTRGIPLLDAHVQAFDPGTWHTHDLAAVDNTASETVCPSAAGPVVYVVRDTDQARYLLDLFGAAH